MKKIKTQGAPGFLSIVLHAHLPYVRCPEHDYHLEEYWLYEALTESYIPLLRMFEQLLSDGLDFRVTLSLSPTLLAMLNDSLLQERYSRHLERLISLARDEMVRTRNRPDFFPLAKMYHRIFRSTLDHYERVYRRDLVSAFRRVAETGSVELITSAATHAYLPALLSVPPSVRAQLLTGSGYFEEAFGRRPNGLWLPECGFAPELDPLLREAGVRFFFVEGHGVIAGSPPARKSIYAPVATPAGAVAFARDVDSSHEVWSSLSGYPGDPAYRDFYRDIGFDRAPDMLRDYFPHGIRTFTGLKYFRITGKTDMKQPYVREKALSRARLHAADFVRKKTTQVREVRQRLGISPVITAAFDAELFGHWWFEGIEWLKSVLSLGASSRGSFALTTPSEYISENDVAETCMPCMSSWGKKGYSSTWIDDENNWIYRHIIRSSRLLTDMADGAPDFRAAASPQGPVRGGLRERALNQAARELLLAQASDWPFMMKTGNASEYASKRLLDHIKDFRMLTGDIKEESIDVESLERLEARNALFPSLDYRVFKTAGRPGRRAQTRSLLKG